MKLDLKKMFKEDQRAQDFDIQKIEKSGKVYTDSMNLEIDRIFKMNTETVKKYFESHSYPWLSLNDEKTAINFWTIVQHSDYDVEFQKKVLKTMKKGIKNKTIVMRNYAYLYDRVMKNTNQKQLYGTQVEWIDSKPKPDPELKYPKKVNFLRREIGLDSIEDYYNFLMGINN